MLKLTKIHFPKRFYAFCISLKRVAISPLYAGKENQEKIMCHIPLNKGLLILLDIGLKHKPYMLRGCSENIS